MPKEKAFVELAKEERRYEDETGRKGKYYMVPRDDDEESDKLRSISPNRERDLDSRPFPQGSNWLAKQCRLCQTCLTPSSIQRTPESGFSALFFAFLIFYACTCLLVHLRLISLAVVVAYYLLGVSWYTHSATLGWDTTTAFYFISISITTVGYGDFCE